MFSEVAKNQSFNKKLEKLGIVKKTGYNWKETAQWINQSESFENNQNEKMLVELGITIKYGKAQLVDANTVSVDGILYNTNSIILAFGAKDRPFDFEGSAYMNDSRDFLMQADLPENIVLYGAGIISFAFQNIAQSFGSNVTVLQHDDIALRNFDDLLVQRLIEKNKKLGVQYIFNHKINKIERNEDGTLKLFIDDNELVTDKVFNVAGRVSNIDDLNLKRLGIEYSLGGIKTNEYLQTSIKNIYACGDCCDAKVPKLGTFAIYQAEYLVDHLTNKKLGGIKYPKYASLSVFSVPRLAQVGIPVKEARKMTDEYTIQTIDMTSWLDIKKSLDYDALLELVIRKSDDTIVGSEILSEDADLLINYITMGLNSNLKYRDLKNQIFAYPSLVNNLKRFWK